jgi:FkbM family methyltransferase
MIKNIKHYMKKIITSAVQMMSKTKLGAFLFEQILSTAMHITKSVKHGETKLLFATPNYVNRFRVDTFSTKEPETLEWIDSIPKQSILWDVGANVGLYSCYAAKVRDCQVFAFEPSVFNLELLARNIFLNELTNNVTIVPLPLSDQMSFNTLNMTSMDWGGALSTFGQDYGWDGQRMQQVFQFRTVGLSSSEAVELLNIPLPNYIKIDVDGIEHLILSGAKTILTKVDGLLIEINDDFDEQASLCKQILLEAGLVLKEKRHSEMFNSSESFGGGKVWNQIWHRCPND